MSLCDCLIVLISGACPTEPTCGFLAAVPR